ncbi:MAG: TetR/AcrR family transcriptional regulator [Rubrivivax sp.]|nr:TetR/AcrR family transcriptional regulator [Rubrivivax sp.]
MSTLARPPRAAAGGDAGPPSVKQALLDSAVRLLGAQGPSGATARAVCAEVGVGAPALYHHYGDLPSLHRAAVNAAFDRVAVCYRPRSARRDALQSVRDSWALFMQFAAEQPTLCRLVVQQVASGDAPPSVVAAYTRMVADLGELRAQGRLARPPADAAQMLWAAALGAAVLVACAAQDDRLDPNLNLPVLEALLAALLTDPVQAGTRRPAGKILFRTGP